MSIKNKLIRLYILIYKSSKLNPLSIGIDDERFYKLLGDNDEILFKFNLYSKKINSVFMHQYGDLGHLRHESGIVNFIVYSLNIFLEKLTNEEFLEIKSEEIEITNFLTLGEITLLNKFQRTPFYKQKFRELRLDKIINKNNNDNGR